MGKFRAIVGASCAITLGAVTACAPNPTMPVDNGRYVATTGADVGTCAASASPCSTITYAVSQAVVGETVHVAAGTYPELVIVNKGLIFEGANANKAAGTSSTARSAESIVKGFRNPGEPHPLAAGASSVTINGFTIDPQGDATLIAPSTHHLVSLFGGPQVSIRDNIFKGGPYDPSCGYDCTTMTDAAVMVQSGTYEVKDNTFTNFRSPVDVTQFNAAHPVVSGTITGNAFTHITNRAIWVNEYQGGPFPGVISVTGNNFDATGWTSTTWSPAGIVMTSGGNSVTGNSFTGFGSGVFLQVCDGTNVANTSNTFTGNIFTSNRSGIQVYVASAVACGPVNAIITGNQFEGTFTGVGLTDVPEIGVRWNGDVGTNGATAPNTLNAECNWWGVASGPGINGTAGVPGATTVTLGVDATPWNIANSGPCSGS